MPISYYLSGYCNGTCYDVYGWEEQDCILVINSWNRTILSFAVRDIKITGENQLDLQNGTILNIITENISQFIDWISSPNNRVTKITVEEFRQLTRKFEIEASILECNLSKEAEGNKRLMKRIVDMQSYATKIEQQLKREVETNRMMTRKFEQEMARSREKVRECERTIGRYHKEQPTQQQWFTSMFLDRTNKRQELAINHDKTEDLITKLNRELAATKKQLEVLEETFRIKQERAKAEYLTEYTGMYEIGSPIFKCASTFKKLRDNGLVNSVFSLSVDNALLDIIFPIISKYAFHLFWSTNLDELEPSHNQKATRAKEIKDNKDEIRRCAERITEAAYEEVSSHLNGISNSDFQTIMLPFLQECAQWHVEMVLCEPVLELLPRNRIPKKGTPLNKLEGQQFELRFEEKDAVVDRVDGVGLMARDLNGTVFYKAQLVCSLRD